MRSLLLSPAVLALPLLLPSISARFLHSLPEDPYAFPKYRVDFLNGLPVLNQTAQRWLHEGLRGGELEFQDQPWKDADVNPHTSLKEIGSSDSRDQVTASDSRKPTDAGYSLELMKMGNKNAYICLIPKALETPASSEEHEAEVDITPARSWQLLQPLTGTCIYHRQGWFTYSYCHNDKIRQFKELAPSHGRAPGAQPEEDEEWESYTLGRAPVVPEPGADLTLAERNAQAANLELARNAGSRYLVQRWGDGTICDKTGKPREVEVQFHCSMTMTDSILFVKEAKTCSYVLVINTPRLCGEPGFKSKRDSGEEAHIRCREIVDSPTQAENGLPITDYPLKFPPRKPVLPPPQQVSKDAPSDPVQAKEKIYKDFVKQTIEALVKQGELDTEDTEVIIQLDDDPISEDDQEETAARLVEALRAVGYEVNAEILTSKGSKDISKGKKEKGSTRDSKDTKDKNGDGKKKKLRKFMDNFNHHGEL